MNNVQPSGSTIIKVSLARLTAYHGALDKISQLLYRYHHLEGSDRYQLIELQTAAAGVISVSNSLVSILPIGKEYIQKHGDWFLNQDNKWIDELKLIKIDDELKI